MSSEVASYQRPVSLQFGDSETSGASQSFAGYVAGSVQFHSSPDHLNSLPHAEGASFNSGELEHERLCLPGTRTKIFELVEQWIVNPQGQRIFWDTENRTLAALIRKAFDLHPDIIKRAKRDQWRYLIQEPLSQTERQSPHGFVLIFVIDALDECDDDRDVQLILKILSEAKSFDHIQFRVFITGRPNSSVRDAFLDRVYQSLILHEIERYVVQQDLRIFFEYELRSIKKRHRLIGDFPGKGDVEILVQRTGELFIYAATICRFIDERKHPPPRERLKVILQNNSSAVSALKNLDQLYIQFLQEAVPEIDSVQDKRVFCSHFRLIIGAIVSLFSSLSVSSLAALLFLELESIDPTLDSLLSILNIPQEDNATMSLVHPSFRDFLLDKTRCTDLDFWVDSAKTHLALTETCLSVMAAGLKRDICDLRLPGTLTEEIDTVKIRANVPAELEYACTYWGRHLESSILENSLLDRIREFLEHSILYWFEALSLLGKMHESVLMLSTLFELVQSHKNTRLVNLVHDAYRFSLEHRYIIEKAPLQTYHSALMFSPSTSLIRKLFESQVPCWVQCLSEVANDWGSLLQTLEGHTGPVTSVTFSSDGQKLASASWDSVRIWNTETGTPLQTLLQGDGYSRYNSAVSVTFSFDGQRVACFSPTRGLLCVWNVVLGSLLHKFSGNDYEGIISIAFSPDGQSLVFGYGDGMAVIRDITLGSALKTFEGRAHITSVTFSPDGQKLATACNNRYHGLAISIWDVASGSKLQMFEGKFESVAFSPDGQILAAGSTNGTVHIWDAESGSLLLTLHGHTYPITWIAFLYNGHDIIACRFGRNKMRVWNVNSGLLLRIHEANFGETSVAISPDGQKLASGRDDHTVNITNIAFRSSVQTLKGHHDCIRLMELSSDGQKLASVSGRDLVCVWDVVTGSLLQMLKGCEDTEATIKSIKFSPDGQKLVSRSGNSHVDLYDVPTGSLLLGTLDPDRSIDSTTFSPDGEKFAYVTRSYIPGLPGHRCFVHVWDAGFGSQKLEPSCRGITSVKFSPGGQKLASLSHSSIIQVWNAMSGAPLQKVADDDGWVRSSTLSIVNQPKPKPKLKRERLSIIDRWVTVNRKNFIWLPPARQASKFVTHGTKVAIGSTTGVVTILDLDFKQMDLQPTSPSVPLDESGSDLESDWSLEQDD